MDMAENRNSRDLAITPGRFALVLDRTKGYVETLTGPYKSSLADTQTPVLFRPDTSAGYTETSSPQEAVQPYVVARQGQYVVLQNPAKNNAEKSYPEDGKGQQAPALDIGNVVNIPGPITMALWWQQSVTVIDGHQLRSNQFLVVEVTDEEQAKKNWKQAIFKTATDGKPAEGQPVVSTKSSIVNLDPTKFTTGQRLIISGSEISFFIPPTGMRVVTDPKTTKYVREAVTLESQQYCVLLGEDGKKRYIPGPDVVFPTATETFIEDGGTGSRVFKCIELSPTSGIHVMVIDDYKEGEGDKAELIKAGTELFITGKEEPIYFPRPEHAIIKHDGENFIHFATAVPEGEGRYVLNKLSGEVELRVGPAMILLDPTKFVFVRRVLTQRQANLYFPGNAEVAQMNESMSAQAKGLDYLSAESGASYSSMLSTRSPQMRARTISADVVERKSTYSQPRTLTLDTKYQGAIPINIWPGYAVQVLKKDGTARTVKGPKCVLLAYDEDLTRLALSSGKPKNTDNLYETVYLKLSGNQVSDIVTVDTADGVSIEIKLILQVMFTGEDALWFTVDNYVKQITDHVRSLLRGAVKKQNVIDFTRDPITVVRDAILGAKVAADKVRAGCSFSQNGAQIYDVEVLRVVVADPRVASLIADAQQDLVKGMADVMKRRQAVRVAKETETATREILVEQQQTVVKQHEAKLADLERQIAAEMLSVNARITRQKTEKEAELEAHKLADDICALVRARQKLDADQNQAIRSATVELELKNLQAETASIKERLTAITPQFVAALQAGDDREALVELADKLGIAAYLKNDSIGAMINAMLADTPLKGVISKLGKSYRGEEQ